MSEVINENLTQQTEIPTVEVPENNPEVKTFTQEDIDKIVAERIGREKKKFADYDDLKSKASEYEKISEEKRLAELSATERAEELAKKFEEERNGYAQQLETLNAKIQSEKITNAFLKAAPSAGIPNDEKRLEAAFKLFDSSAVSIEEDKVVGIEDALKSLVEQYSFLVSEQKNPPKPIGEPSNGGANNEEAKTLEVQLADAKKAKDFVKVIELSNKIAGLFKK